MVSDKIITLSGKSIVFEYPTSNYRISFIPVSSDEKTFVIRDYYNHFCRETFACSFRNSDKYMAITQFNLDIVKINKFFEEIEETLKLDVKTVFHPTQAKNVWAIELSPFWNKNHACRQVLTLMLRCAGEYYKDGETIKSALNKYELTKSVLPALHHFFAGYTNFTGHDTHYGFVRTFKDAPAEKITKLLTKQ